MTITHNMGNAIPPPSRRLMIVEWTSKLPGEKPQEKTAMLPPGWEVREQFRDEYWVAHKMHGEFAALSRANNLPLPKEFAIMFDGELVGCGLYQSEDLHDRAMVDTTVREFEWEQRGTGEVPMIGVIMGDVPEDQEAEFVRRTGTQVVGVGHA